MKANELILMKANELMTGDWVRVRLPWRCPWDGHIEKRWYMRRVTGVRTSVTDANKIYLYFEPWGVLPEDIEPIPLSPVILEKNGWKLVPDTPYDLVYLWSTEVDGEYTDVRIIVGKDHDNVWRWDFPILNIHLYRGSINLTKFKYLHELQHALRLCGIDKQIEL